MLEARMDGAKIAVLGAGVSGVSLALMAAGMGASVFLSDAGEISGHVAAKLTAGGATFESGGHTDVVLGADRVVVGSGFPYRAEVVTRIEKKGIPLLGELDFVMPYLQGRFVAITGSNGKTTTTSLLGHLLASLGFDVAVAGNIGLPIGDLAGRKRDFIVAELSSFQLHWARALRLEGAIVTNLAPDHIDWHGSYENYVRAKARIFDFVQGDGFSILQSREREALRPSGGRICTLDWNEEEGNPNSSILLSAVKREAYLHGERLFAFSDTSLLGAHNMENVAMVLSAVSLLGADVSRARASLAGYLPPPHRCSLVLEAGGVRYVDDSKGTNIAAAVTALSSIEGRKIVILGGRGKGEDYANLLPALRENAKLALLIGEAAGDIAKALEAGGFEAFLRAGDMKSAVCTAAERAEAGDVVLLSPACTSWDAYRNYGERGDHFIALVRGLKGVGALGESG